MSTRYRLLLVTLGALVVAATFTFPQWQPLMLPANVGGDADPLVSTLAPALQPTFMALPAEQQAAYRAIAQQSQTGAVTLITSALATPIPLSAEAQALPSMSGAFEVATGTFQPLDSIRVASGDVIIYQQADDSKIIRFENFGVTNGPNLQVILSASAAPTTPEEMMLGGADVNLGALQSAVGSQNYSVPPELDIATFNSVVVYSDTVGLVYTYAPLVPG